MSGPNSTTERGVTDDEVSLALAATPFGSTPSTRLWMRRALEAIERPRQPTNKGGIPPLNSVVGYDDSGTAHSLEVLFCDSTPAGLRVAVQLATPPATSGMKDSLVGDAERYRWFRKDLAGLDAQEEFPGLYEGCPDGLQITEENFDAAIDAAIRAGRKG